MKCLAMVRMPCGQDEATVCIIEDGDMTFIEIWRGESKVIIPFDVFVAMMSAADVVLARAVRR